jgi:hypothetical protein
MMEETLIPMPTILEKYGIVFGIIFNTLAKDDSGGIAISMCKDVTGTKWMYTTCGNVRTGSDHWTSHMILTIMGLGKKNSIKSKKN